MRATLAEVRLRENDRACGPQLRDEMRIVGRAVIGERNVLPRGAAHVESVVLILDRKHHALQRPHELPRCRELPILRGGHLERVGHVRIGILRVRHAARLALIEAQLLAGRRPEIQRDQRVDLPGIRNRLDHAENALGLLHAGPVIGLDAREIGAHHLLRRHLFRKQCGLDLRDARLGHFERSRRAGRITRSGGRNYRKRRCTGCTRRGQPPHPA